MTITWKSNYEQFKAAAFARIWATPGSSLRFAINYIFIPILAFIGFAIFFFHMYAGRKISSTEYAIVFALPAVAIGNWVSWFHRLRKLYENAWPSNVTERRTTLTFCEEGVHIECPGVGKSLLEWNGCTRFVETKKEILICLNQTPKLIIPRQNLTEDQNTELVQLLQTKLGR